MFGFKFPDLPGTETAPAPPAPECTQNFVIWSEVLDEDNGDDPWETVNLVTVANQANDLNGQLTLEQATFSWSSNWVRQLITVVAETTYRFSFEAKRGTATEAHYGIYDQNHFAFIIESTSYYDDINADNPVRIEVEFTTPSGCTSVYVGASYNTPVTEGTMFIGRCQLEENGSCYIKTEGVPITP